MKNLLLLLLFPFFAYSQYCPALGPNQLLPCGVNSTTLTADLSQCGPGGPNPNQTTNYGVANIPYVAQTNSGTQITQFFADGIVNNDDGVSNAIPLPFNFCFFGQTYNQFWVGSNGWISFSPPPPFPVNWANYTSASIPTAAPNVPKNCIMGPWQDWYPGFGGQVRYQVSGVAPCRKLTVSWIGVPMFSCTNLQGTFHIIIYESTNVIENHIQSKPNCPGWANGTAVQGIHNLAGTIGIATPGRNSTTWTTQNNSYRWTPSGPTVTPTLTWYQVGNPNPIGTGPTITVTPPLAGANYTCHLVYPICNAGWSTCNAGIGNLGPDTVFVAPGPPNLPPPNVVINDPHCNNGCDGDIIITPNGGTGVTTISWNGLGNNFNLTNLCSGIYTYNLVDAAGCTYNSSVTLNNPPPLQINQITGLDTVCYNSTFNTYGVTSVFPNLGYVWINTIGNITTGQGTDQINLDVTGVNGGLYNNTLSVIGVNQLGCQSLPETFNLVVLNIIPSITQVGPFCEYDNCINLIGTPQGGIFNGLNVWGEQYCPNNGFIGIDVVNYNYVQSGCLFNTSINIQVYPRPLITTVVNGIFDENSEYHEICEGDTISDIFDVLSTSGGYNEWYVFGDTILNQNLNITWDQDGIFQFQVVRWDNGCASNPESFFVTIELCPNEIFYIPNAFTPNGDERNNTFRPIITSGVDIYNYSFVIYNRWGQIIWESYNPNIGWDGIYDNVICQDGVYNWKLKFKTPKVDNIKEFFGNLTIIR